MSAIEEIEKTVLALPVEQRVTLAESLLSSLPPAGEAWSEAEELAEVERREREIESGQAQPLPEAEFWRRVAGSREIIRETLAGTPEMKQRFPQRAGASKFLQPLINTGLQPGVG